MSDKVGRCAAALLLATGLVVGCSKPKAEPVEQASEHALGEAATNGQGLVISQVYGGGGATGAVWNRDFVELFNTTKQPIPLKGLSLHYSGPISEFGLAARLPEDAVVPAGGYYLVGFLAGQTGLDLRPDSAGLPINLLPVNGKIALVRSVNENSGDAAAQAMGCGSADAGTCVNNGRAIDVVGYGVTSDHEGPTTANAPSLKSALLRKGAGCTDTGNNAADFDVAEPKPRSAASPARVCGGTP